MMFRGFSFCTRFGSRYLISQVFDSATFEADWPDFDPEPLPPPEAGWALQCLSPQHVGPNEDLRRFWRDYESESFSLDLSRRSDQELYKALVHEVCGPFGRRLAVHRQRSVGPQTWRSLTAAGGGTGVIPEDRPEPVSPSRIARRQAGPVSSARVPARWIEDILKIMCPKDKAFLDGREKEYDAYIKEDGWRISHGLPPHDPSFRTKNAAGKEITNEAGVRAMVDKEYPGVTATSGSGPPEQIVGNTRSGDTVVQRADGSRYTRPPKKGDSFAGDQITVPKGGIPLNMEELKCP